MVVVTFGGTNSFIVANVGYPQAVNHVKLVVITFGGTNAFIVANAGYPQAVNQVKLVVITFGGTNPFCISTGVSINIRVHSNSIF